MAYYSPWFTPTWWDKKKIQMLTVSFSTTMISVWSSNGRISKLYSWLLDGFRGPQTQSLFIEVSDDSKVSSLWSVQWVILYYYWSPMQCISNIVITESFNLLPHFPPTTHYENHSVQCLHQRSNHLALFLSYTCINTHKHLNDHMLKWPFVDLLANLMLHNSSWLIVLLKSSVFLLTSLIYSIVIRFRFSTIMGLFPHFTMFYISDVISKTSIKFGIWKSTDIPLIWND